MPWTNPLGELLSNDQENVLISNSLKSGPNCGNEPSTKTVLSLSDNCMKELELIKEYEEDDMELQATS